MNITYQELSAAVLPPRKQESVNGQKNETEDVVPKTTIEMSVARSKQQISRPEHSSSGTPVPEPKPKYLLQIGPKVTQTVIENFFSPGSGNGSAHIVTPARAHRETICTSVEREVRVEKHVHFEDEETDHVTGECVGAKDTGTEKEDRRTKHGEMPCDADRMVERDTNAAYVNDGGDENRKPAAAPVVTVFVKSLPMCSQDAVYTPMPLSFWQCQNLPNGVSLSNDFFGPDPNRLLLSLDDDVEEIPDFMLDVLATVCETKDQLEKATPFEQSESE